MLKRGLYRNLLTDDIVWLLYELDGRVTFSYQSTGKAESLLYGLFTSLYEFHSGT